MQQSVRWLCQHWRGVVITVGITVATGLLGGADMRDFCARPEVVCE